MTDMLTRPLMEIAAALDAGTLRAGDLAAAAIANHARYGEALAAYSLWAPEHARRCAAAADAAFAAGCRTGPLQGIPFSVKDLFGVPGFPTFAGTKRRLPPGFEAAGPLVAALRRQLTTIMGKTHMVEFAYGGTGQNSHWGAPRNPWDATAHRSPGGSSSGAGVSLAEGSALLAFGTDTAGSVRIPASMTGQVGLKVTIGRWSAEGIVPLSFSYDTPGLLARSVADAAYGFAALDARLGDARGFLARLGNTGIDGIRIGLGEDWFWEGADPGIAEAVKAALDQLGRAGAVLSEAALPEAAGAYAVFCEGGLSGIELRGFLDAELPEWVGLVDAINVPPLRATETLLARDYLARRFRLDALARAAVARLDTVDVIASPTLLLTPPVMADVTQSESHWAANRRIVRNTVIVNFLGLCAITVPVALDRAGLPVGLQLIARGGDDERLLAIALAAERVLGTARERLGRPPLGAA